MKPLQGGTAKTQGITLSFEERTDYVFAKINSIKHDLSDVVETFRRIRSELAKNKSRKLLVLADVAENLSLSETFEVVQELVELKYQHINLAYCYLSKEHSDLIEFAVTAARNRGLRIEMFDDLTEAENWLKALNA